MAELDDLKAADQAIKDGIAALSVSVTNEIARVEAAIAALSVTGISPADVAAVTADLQVSVANLKAATAALDAERAVIASPAA